MLKLPSWASVLLGLGAGLLAVLNEVSFGFSTEWRGYLSVALVFLAGLGISPLVGTAFRAALHLSTAVSLLISSALGALALAVHTFNLAEGLRGVLQGVLAFAAAIGFAPTTPEAEAIQAKRLPRPRGLATLVMMVVAGGVLLLLVVVV